MRDSLGEFKLPTSPGMGTSRLFKVTRKGKGKRFVRKLISKRAGARGTARGKRARSVGTSGADMPLDRASALASWLAPTVQPGDFVHDCARLQAFGCEVFVPAAGSVDIVKAQARADLLATLCREEKVPRMLLAIGARAAQRQVQRLAELRGVTASYTSTQEASSAAVAGILAAVRRLDKVPGRLWHGCGADDCDCPVCVANARFVRVLKLYAGRAAFKSLATWATVGITGDNSSATFAGRSFVAEFTTELANQIGMESWRASDRVWFESEQAARWRMARWIYRVGVYDFCSTLTGKGTGMARKQARSRCRVVCSMLFGASLVDACAHAGFESVGAWGRSCKGAKLFESLRESRRAQLVRLPSVLAARSAMRESALQAANAIKSMRSTSGHWAGPSPTLARKVTVASGASSVRYVSCGYRVTSPAGQHSFQVPGVRGTGTGQAGFVWLHASNAREQAIGRAVWHRDQALELIASNLRAFDRVLAGLHSEKFGNLRHVFGFVDRKGRERSSKVNPALIGRARGKLSRKASLASTVTIQARSRSLQCAPSVSVQAWAQSGEAGFAIVKGHK